MKKNICGIQQIGIGLKDARVAWKWYRKTFGMDINVLEDTAVAKLMLHYTNGQECERYAAIALNMEGGGGFEVWQHTGITPKPPVFDVRMGDCGIFICKMKTRNIKRAYKMHKEQNAEVIGDITKTPDGREHYFLKDPYNNIFEVVEEPDYFKKEKSPTGGVYGAVIGVSDIEKAREVYSDILNYDEVVYDETGVFADWAMIPGGEQKYRRVLLKHKPRSGSFSKLLGPGQIELVQALDREPGRIFKDRIWGELGFIHICFDVKGMNLLEKECTEKGYPFTVNSADSFDMGEAAGQFSYISDPDGTPIEFVEAHKLPVIKKLGWYMNLKGRDAEKSLPGWMIKTMQLKRIKD
ncbi:VOC family protein [Alkalitalea saponilacus]|uniref:Catechol 2,3-dioxygenase n=1 Tax=Alkalitalea saponilacus TaxID=889453 RepID=A0A1T5HTS5_9BACT|nr:VOC family protein [Alkalitalea saponilacus]ASB49962.1 glyoxalase [Alkalitalea saponilacus]SKC24032.1 Catechol 2,3-dioxygenase [Alkalitalea saponilacus]